MGMTLTSLAFADHGAIPRLHTCQGRNVSPPLAWNEPPFGTQSFVLIVDDPDAPDPAAPRMVWVHWLLYNLPATCRGLAEAATDLPQGTLHGINDAGADAYYGPCPPIGRHRYVHKLYALDCQLPDLQRPNKDRLLRAMAGHVLADAQLIGTYAKE